MTSVAAGNSAGVWVVLALVAALMSVVVWHIVRMHMADMPASRRRIRTANGMLMLLALPMVGYATLVNPTEGGWLGFRTAAIVWLCVGCVLLMIIAVSLLDVANTLRLYRHARTALEREEAGRAGGGRHAG